MQGDKQVIAYLSGQLKLELSAISQYFLHARMLRNWALPRRAKHEYEVSIEDMNHTEEHMDYLETQIELVEKVDEQNYLQSQMHTS